MSATWSKLKKTLSFKSFGGPSSQNPPPSSPNQVDSGSAVCRSPSSVTSSNSFSSRLSRSLSSNHRYSKKTCAICLGNIKAGQGQAIFTAECSHTFHFRCIANSVRHGNYLCPICRSKWKEIPFQLPNVSSDPYRNAAGQARVSPYHVPLQDYPPNYTRVLQSPSTTFSDDEPLLAVSTDLSSLNSRAFPINVTVKAFPEFPAVAASESVSGFAVLVGVRAPPILEDARYFERAPIDLVTVLDVSGSMSGTKLVLLKRAVSFVIENLGPSDRLSIVSFSASSRRIFPLRRMTDIGREDARLAVNSLSADGGTNIVEGLKKGARVLEERRERNPVASIILLSDGKDTYNSDNMSHYRRPQNQTSSDPSHVLEYLNLLPVSICPTGETQNEGPPPTFPIHTFGFGSDHDSSAMHAISNASGGTFSFIESVGMVQDAFARCIGGLLSVVAQELRLTVRPASPGVEIEAIPSGRYANEISEGGSQGVITIGDLYADEEKEFLVYLSIPAFAGVEGEDGVGQTSLLQFKCSHRDAVSKEMVHLEGERVEIRRPTFLSPTDVIVSVEVDRQRNRLWVAEAIAEAQQMAEMGNLEGAQAMLTNRRATLLSSASSQAGDGLCSWLQTELTEIRERMANMEMYEHTGRAYVLSGLSSHSWQRATTRGDSNGHSAVLREGGSTSHSGAIGYDTPSMVSMVSKSQNLSALNPPEQVLRLNKSTSLTRI
ncbi:Zinc finger (C3HC4-type RING finger) family protein [Abeliophyllum distichum]|uniref:Zinc finger (C3HC4-type RING finger) family protein n=1 Tax=Abeliophyllum distichum TaxID=126358 RepID=A0ABD1QGR5_9LAMI